MRTGVELEELHRYSNNHREVLQAASRAGCFYCGAVFSPVDIEDWIDGPQAHSGHTGDGVTALCPHRGMDSVLPQTNTITITPQLLSEMREFWFG